MGSIALLIVLFTIAFSYRGFVNHSFFDRYKFEIDGVLVRKQYIRLLSSGFLHVGWTHLVLNMVSLVFFSGTIEDFLGPLPFLVVYFSSLIGGSLLALFIHRNHGEYSAAGASGAVCGVIFAGIALMPGMNINFFFVPLPIPGWLYGIAYVLYSIYGIRSRKDNIGHEAHLGGALIGMIIALLFIPSSFAENYITIILIAAPAIIFIIMIIRQPHLLLVDNFFFKKRQQDFYSIDHKYNSQKRNQQDEIDRILDKINKKGMKSLTEKEKAILNEYSKK